MMKSLYRQNNRQTSPLFGALTLVILISVVVFGFDTLTHGLVRSYIRTMGSLAWTAVGAVITSVDQSGALTTRRALVNENKALKEELSIREEEAARFFALESENEALRTITHLVETEGEGMTARVLSSFSTSPYGTFLIGAGKNDGVSVGDLVMTQGGFVLGLVSDVDMHTATVESLFAPGTETDFLVRDIAFTAEGRGGGNTRADVPRDAAVAIGDAAAVPSFGGRPAGIVGHIESASSSATQTLFIRIPTNLSTLTFVYVIPQEKE